MLGAMIAFLGMGIEVAMGKSASFEEAIDDIVIGIVAAFMVFIYEQRRHRAILDKVRVIAGMNHHVRNALQAISYVPYTEQEKQIKMVEESVQRIEWALREILPGDSDSQTAKPPALQPEPVRKSNAS